MSSLYRKLRHYYWLLSVFSKKNAKFLTISFIAGFFLIFVFINIFPLFNSLFFQKTDVIGIVGTYNLQNIPDEVKQEISNPLVTVDQNGEIRPVLANSWEILNNGKTYRFHLKADLYWTDKKKFTAHDIEYNFQDVAVQVVDDYTLDFVLSQPLIIFPIYLTKPVVKQPLIGIGSGYTVQSYKLDKNVVTSIHLTPNKENLPLKTYRFYQTEDDLITAYKKGEITFFRTSNRNIADVFSNWKNTEIKRDIDYTQILTLFLNTQSSILQERDARKSLAYTIGSFNESGVPAKSPIPPTSWAYLEDVREYTRNEERARSLIEDTLKESTASSKLTLYTFFDYVDVAEELKKNFEEIGLDITLKVVSYIPDKFDMLLTVWNPPVDPDQYFFWHSTQTQTNLTKLNNVKIDKLLEDGRRVVNVKQRKNIYNDFQKTILEEVPAIFIYHPYLYTVSRR
ncbi:hypothetical protein A3H80_04500 [Candidatus Roizmanbacteria bacterium RIFCSPLOWO2_02_FULL_37_19]|uniref:Solute-binding protein family 5 domain-containing protein n=1 Tax=Candidatus Roizmanbacteria bacterium RIFCSPHIGHO2_02_FULL_37_24 TaxID=1802037 RepID=A0A1F7GXK0_9BACT|nr:MAG: hypothetical protein A2862_01225 [Candidatus Roizmanbacteria bacterium RIFCSPHIGHO2_01_FULL_38_41]OGK23573.1 MAG: hypothetical protein A3C24_00090 [Candidatus Roizmanbacteria bacterium RIFCSPHIGHO2_02_FULL_37_24]OGK33280.1 MAG: hypothetical protein A3E10_04725 [Candidatus Roizmanbacteria bacterium RIFCSPHIGHO2_12_FULL_37_23]OGK43351.1 MAG: hypothetical protein A2956_02075 [Candidatus Roizmanbacteria bacterium RIFCSPLOWO2_01_FULL_37_57]OGK53691.1 MAG: hypothetical protein A3H80_04500 [Ca